MGLALCKSQVFRPDIIQGQLTMTNFNMLKMFLSAALVSTAGIQWMGGKKWVSLDHPAPSWGKSIVGGLILGCGMYISGACPGTVLSQIGPGIKSAQYTLAGGILGAFVYGLVESYIPKTPNSGSVDSALKVSRKASALVMMAGMAAVLAVLETYRPWQVDVGLPTTISQKDLASLWSPIWSPYMGGAIIGLLQFPSFLLINHGLGCSSGYVSLLSHIMGPNMTKKFDYFNKYCGSALAVWQLFLDVGIIAGSAICYRVLTKVPAFSFHSSYPLLGGFLLIFGARLANGCTSGHGLTGMAKLNVGSILSVCGMFGGGMLTAYVAANM